MVGSLHYQQRMSEKGQRILTNLKTALNVPDDVIAIATGRVVSVNEDNNTCNVDLRPDIADTFAAKNPGKEPVPGVVIYGVKLSAFAGENKAAVIIPEIGSDVLIVNHDESEWRVLKVEVAAKAKLNISADVSAIADENHAKFTVKDTSVTLNKTDAIVSVGNTKMTVDNSSATVQVGTIKISLDKDGVYLNGDGLGGLIKIAELVTRLNSVESALSDLITKYNGHIHVTTATPGTSPIPGVISPTTATSASVVTQTSQSQLENTNVKHG